MTDASEPSADDVVTCTTAPDLVTATAIASFLTSYAIDATVADSTTATMDWGMQQAMGGIRVQVPKRQLDEARALLASSEAPGDDDHGPDAEADDTENEADHAARRAMRGSIAAWLVMPFLHPLTMGMALRASAMPGLSPKGRRHLIFAFVNSTLGLLLGGAMALAYLWTH